MRGIRLRPFGLPLVLSAAVAVAAPVDPPPHAVVVEAERIVQEMRADQRGPYSRIRWYCNDGTVQPPVAYACREHGGGRQHAEYSQQRQRLAELGWHVGTIFAATPYEALMDAAPREGRLRELPLERYLVDTDNGWVLERARSYRGRVQVEDEEAAGRALLQRLAVDERLGDDDFLLLREAARTIPHGRDTDLARTVRRAAVDLAELDPTAERWRAEIHGSPGPDLVPRFRKWIATRSRPDVVTTATKLAEDLDTLYGPAGVTARAQDALDGLRGSRSGARWRETVVAALARPPAERLAPMCAALAEARAAVFASLGPAGRVALLDAMQELETTVQLAYRARGGGGPTRRALLADGVALLDCAYASGLLSGDERDELAAGLSTADGGALAFGDYRRAVGRLKRAPAWALGTIRYTFAEPLARYTALDPRAARFSDDLLRGSPLWMLGETLQVLSQDVDALAGSTVELAGRPVGTAVALNTGLARGTLRVFETIDAVERATLHATDIVAIPETIAELSPVAGILTLGEGNALSHVQLLARNFGIPNVAVDFETVETLKALAGSEVLLVVDANGNVVLRPVDDEVLAAIDAVSNKTVDVLTRIEVPMPDLTVARVLPLGEIGRALSGKVIGPKAANLGELNRLFPGRVAPAVAIPFGIYAQHLRDAGIESRIASAFAARENGTLAAADFDAEIARIRADVAALTLNAATRAELTAVMADAFGEPGSYGVFVRSDTNVEDLPQFTGAGLNETVPNVVGLDAQLGTVPRVWSSVLSPRALAWRSSVLANPARIYASVLLMKSVPATKSGVLVTSNLIDRSQPGLTVSAAWGVGGAVAGEAAEGLVIFPDRTEIVSEAKSPYQRHLSERGGVTWLPAPAGGVLEPAEIDALRALAGEVNEKYAPVMDENGVQRPWDIEFGFIDGELTLFQIRPLVERGSRNADALLRQLKPDAVRTLPDDRVVRLDAAPGAGGDEE